MTMGPIEQELREGPGDKLHVVWLGEVPASGGMSIEAFALATESAVFHGLEWYSSPEETISYAIEAAAELGL